MICRAVIVLFLAASSLTGSLTGQEPRLDYAKDIQPIFKDRCVSCHGGLKQEAGLRLDTGALIRRGGDSGAVVTPGDVEQSTLIERITAEDESYRMPPEGKPLTEKQIQRLQQWIEQGAVSPENETAEADPRDHWAFQPPTRPKAPYTKHSWPVRSPIDAFVASQHQQRGLKPNPPASKHVLLRRVYLDLIGVPPTREQLQTFLADDSDRAYEQVVDRLLADPRYGQRWGRHWMDVWRYSDWYGRRGVPDALNSYGQIWRWRDWIVRSLNRDKGYDQMVKEMLAADEIAPTDDDNLMATGFIVRNYYRWNYATWMKDLVEHTGKAFLGVTLNCCHCHDHKYDPFSNVEYFRFRAVFEPIDIRQDRVPGEKDPGLYPDYKLSVSFPPMASGMVRIMDRRLNAKTFIYAKGESRDIIPGKPPVRPGAPSVLGGDALNVARVDLPAEAWYPGLKEFVRQEERKKADDEVYEAESAVKKAEQLVAQATDKNTNAAAEFERSVADHRLAWAKAKRTALEARIRADQVRYQDAAGDAGEVARDASRAEREAACHHAQYELVVAERALATAKSNDAANDNAKAAQETKTAQSNLDKMKTALEKAKAAVDQVSNEYTALSPQYARQSTGRRRALAEWIARRDNPVTARVAVNHIWRWHFGKAIVETTANLGRNGASPTHPQLLDWLAVELMDNDWQMKHIHRLLVTSTAYRMSSAAANDEASQRLDRENIYLWRFPRRRMEAEVIRDSVLHTAGRLDVSMGGKEIPESQGMTSLRRSMYFETHGEGQMQWLQLFDAANPVDCYQRSSSVRPQQALAMVNSELALQQGRKLARTLHQQFPANAPTANAQVNHQPFIIAAFKQILSRSPTAEELSASNQFLAEQTALLNKSDLKPQAKEPVPPSTDPLIRARENFIHSLYSHNDFVTIH